MDPAKQICRFCLAEEHLLTDCSLYGSALQAKLTTVFTYCFTFINDTSLPSSICTGCYLKIDEYYEFTEKVRQNQEKLIAQEALVSQFNIKLESTGEELLEKPIIIEEPILNCHQTITIKAEVVSDEVVHEGGEAQIVSSDSNQCTVLSQDEMVQFKIEFEDTELQSEGEPSGDQANKTAEEDRVIKEFFGLICETCSTHFDSFTQLKQHTREMHNKELSFTCCDTQHSRRCQVLDHIALHSNPHQFLCDSCDKTFQQKKNLRKHRLLVHSGEEERPFKCDQCKRSFTRRYLLTRHMTKHLPMECDICHKVVSNSANLSIHKKGVHSHANKYVCDICGNELSSKSNLHRHKMQVHEPAYPAARVDCSHCRRSFASKEILRVHLKSIQENEATCDVCNQVHPNRKALLAHMARVHVEAKHECDVCGKKFKLKAQLRTHCAIHTGEKLYSCNLCGLRMNAKNNLYTHRKKKHAKEWAEMKQKERQLEGITWADT